MDVDGKQSKVALLKHSGHRFLERESFQCPQHEKGPDHRMPGEGNFLRRGKNTHFDHRRLVGRRKDEHGFRQIHFAGDLLELDIGQPIGIGKHRDRIPTEWFVGKYIRMVELQFALLGHRLLTKVAGGMLPRVGFFCKGRYL